MAQDFGDDVGEMLFIRLLGRYCEKAAGIVLKASLTDAVQRYHQQKLELEGKSKEEAAAEAEVLAKRPQVCVPFGDATRASYFAKVCQDNGVGAFAFSDGKGNGYVSFAKDDVAKVQDCVPQFSKVMTSLKYREINDLLEKAEPVPQEMFDKLEQMDLPDIANDPYSHTDLIRDKVLAAREQCRDFEDFKAILAENGIGTRFNDEGELQFYEGRLGENGEMLDFVNGTDWPVNAKTLAGDKYQCDATLDWFEKNTPKEPSGIDSLNHAHSPIPPQKDLNLICNAVRSDLEERGIQTLDRADGKMGFVVDIDYKKQVVDAVEKHFPGHTPEELGIILEPHHDIGSMTMDAQESQVTDGSLDMNGSTPDINQGIESHDGMDTMVSTLRVEREQNGTEVSPSMVREQSNRSREGYNLKSKADENRAASKQLSQTNDSPDRDISDKFQQER